MSIDTLTRSRWLPATAFTGLAGAVGVLSFADRAPGTTQAILRRVRSVGQRVEQRSGYDLIDRGDVPVAFDTAGHLVLWFLAGLIGWWAFHRRTTPAFLALCLFTVSAGIEVGQSYLSTSRSPDIFDLVANGAGIALGVALAVAIGSAVGAIGRFRTRGA